MADAALGALPAPAAPCAVLYCAREEEDTARVEQGRQPWERLEPQAEPWEGCAAGASAIGALRRYTAGAGAARAPRPRAQPSLLPLPPSPLLHPLPRSRCWRWRWQSLAAR